MVSDSVAEYFCEDPSKFKLDDCCSIFNEFCKKFLRAMQVSVAHAKPTFFKKTNPFKVSLFKKKMFCVHLFAGKQNSGGGRGAAETQGKAALCCQAEVHSNLLQSRQGNGWSCIRICPAKLPHQATLSEEIRKAVVFPWKPHCWQP